MHQGPSIDDLCLSLKALTVDEVSLPTLEEAMGSIKAHTESTMTGWTESTQHYYLKREMNRLISEKAFSEEMSAQLKAHLDAVVSLLLQAKYLFAYDVACDYKNKEHYKNQFLKIRQQLIDKMGEQAFHLFSEQLAKHAQGKPAFLALSHYAEEYSLFYLEHLKKYFYGEYVGHYLAYNFTDQKGELLKEADIPGLGMYERKPIRITEKDGSINQVLIGEILIPKADQDEPTIFIDWKGTNDLATAKADFGISAGEEDYRRHEDRIAKIIADELNNYFAETGKKAKIVITGHSLGGALSQMCFHTLQRLAMHDLIGKDIVKADLYENSVQNFEQSLKATKKLDAEPCQPLTSAVNTAGIDKLILSPWNSTGVLAPVSAHSNELCRVLTDAGILHEAHFGMVGADGVQATGASNILSDFKRNGALITILKTPAEYGNGGFGLKCTGAACAGVAGFTLVNAPVAIALMAAYGAGSLYFHTFKSHTKKNFEEKKMALRENSHCAQLYTSQNPKHHSTIQEHLHFKSSLAVNGVLFLHHLRNGTLPLLSPSVKQKDSHLLADKRSRSKRA